MQTPETPYGQVLPTYDPLASQFMSGGQMGYMPNAQFLTSSQYGAFRTLPQGAQQTQLMQQPSLWQSYLTANRGTLFGLEYLVNTYNPAVDQLRHLTMARRRMADVPTAAGAMGLDVIAPMVAGVGASVLTGNPLIGLAAGMMAPLAAPAVADRLRQARRFQNMSMDKIVAGSDMSSGMGQGFSMSAAGSIDESIRRQAAGDLIFKEADYRKITELGSKAGLFDHSTNAVQYKEIVKKLRGNFKTFMEVLESADIGEISSQMQRLRLMGVSNSGMARTIQAESMYSRMAGISHQGMVDAYGQQGALIFSQLGLTNYQGSTLNMGNAARVEMMKRMGLLNEAEVARRGGVSGMAQHMTEQSGQMLKSTHFSYLPFLGNADFTEVDPQRLQDILAGRTTIGSAMLRGGSRMRSPHDFSAYESNKEELLRQALDQAGPEGARLLNYRVAQHVMRTNNWSGEDGLRSAYMSLGMNEATAGQQARAMSDPEMVQAQVRQLEFQQHKIRLNAQEERRQERGLTRRLKKWGREMYYQAFEAPIGAWMSGHNQDKDWEENIESGVLNRGIYGVAGGTAGISVEEILEATRATAPLGRETTLLMDGYSSKSQKWNRASAQRQEQYRAQLSSLDDEIKKVGSADSTALVRTLRQERQRVSEQMHRERRSQEDYNRQMGMIGIGDELWYGVSGAREHVGIMEEAQASGRVPRSQLKKALAELQSTYGLSGSDVSRIAGKHLTSVGDLTQDNLISGVGDVLYRQKTEAGIPDAVAYSDSRRQAREIYGNKDLLQVFLSEAQALSPELRTQIGDDLSARGFQGRLLDAEGVKKLGKSLDKRLKGLTEQQMGMFHNGDDLDALKDAAKTSVAAFYGFDAMTLLARWNDGDIDPQTRKRLKGVVENALAQLGLSPEEIQDVLKRPLSRALEFVQDRLKEKNKLSSGQVDKLKDAALGRATDSMSIMDMERQSAALKSIAKDSLRISKSNQSIDLNARMRKSLEAVGRSSLSVDAALEDSQVLKDMLRSDALDAGSRNIISSALTMHSQGKYDRDALLAVMGKDGVLSSEATSYKSEGVEARNADETQALKDLGNSIQGLGGVLSTLNNTNQSVLAYLRMQTAEAQQARVAGGKAPG